MMVGYELDNPLFIFCISYVGLGLVLIFFKIDNNLENSFKKVSKYGGSDAQQLISTIESLVLLHRKSKDKVNERVLLLGYVSHY